MDSREAFEKWYKSNIDVSQVFLRNVVSPEFYAKSYVQVAWLRYQADLTRAQEQSEPVDDRLADWKFDLCKKIDVVIENEYEGDDDEAAKKAYFALRDHIKNMPSVSLKPAQAGWTPIENPPEKWTEVMVWPHPTDYCMTAEFDGNGWQYSEQDCDGAFWSVCKPTHWMPLPAAPKQINNT